MKLRKNIAQDLDQYRAFFFLIGLCISIISVHVAMEWKFADELMAVSLEDINKTKVAKMEEIYIPPTTQELPHTQLKTVLENPEIVEIDDKQTIQREIEMNLDVEVKDYTIPTYSVYGTGTEFEGMATTPQVPITAIPIPEEKEEEVFLIVENKPEFEGGMEGFYEFVAKNLEYPKEATANNIGGKVYLEFIVAKDGSIQDIKVMKGIGYGCDEEAIRVLQKSPKWKPGKQRGRPVKVKMAVPIFFKLILK